MEKEREREREEEDEEEEEIDSEKGLEEVNEEGILIDRNRLGKKEVYIYIYIRDCVCVCVGQNWDGFSLEYEIDRLTNR